METISKQNKNKNEVWYKLISEEDFKEVDINKVKIVDEVHLSSRISIFNIKKYRRYKSLAPIAVRENENGEYELVTGMRTFIVAKLFSRNIKAYMTNLSREEFKEKYNLDI